MHNYQLNILTQNLINALLKIKLSFNKIIERKRAYFNLRIIHA